MLGEVPHKARYGKIDQDYGIRDCAIRDLAGNLVRLQEVG